MDSRLTQNPMNTDSPLYQHYKNQLSQSPLYRVLSDEILSNMLGRFHHTTWRRGMVADPSSLIERFHLIIEGRVKIEHIDAASGDQVIFFIMGPGKGFDVITLLDGQPHAVTPVALDDLHLLTAPMQTVREWINRHPDFNRNFLPYLGEQMRAMEELAMDLATKDTATRLARLFCAIPFLIRPPKRARTLSG